MNRRLGWLKYVLIPFLIVIMVCAMPGSEALAGTKKDYNLDYNDYYTWSAPKRSYITMAPNEGYMIFAAGPDYSSFDEYVNAKYLVEYYDWNYSLTYSFEVPAELTRFGGFYSDGEYYYVLSGQENKNCSNSQEVFRVTKYDLNWTRLGAASVSNCYTTVPFDFGSADMISYGNTLVVKTCRQMYDGHQANFMFAVNTANMKVLSKDCGSYCSHSFNQLLALDGKHLVDADHGDAYPRAVTISKYDSDLSDTTNPVCAETTYNVMSFSGSIGKNYTGASIGGLGVSETSYLVAGSSINQSNFGSAKTRNIFVGSVNKSTGKTQITWITRYSEGSDSATTPYLIQTSEDVFLVLWGQKDKTYYTFVDGKGQTQGGIYSVEGRLSDCKPVVSFNKVVWYYCDGLETKFAEVYVEPRAFVERTGEGVKVFWDPLNNAAKYRVFRKTEYSDWKKIATTTETVYTDPAPEGGTINYYAVQAMTSSGSNFGSRSDEVSILITAPPINLTLTATDESILLNWPEFKYADKYRIYKLTETGSWKKLATVTSAEYEDFAVKAGEKCTYTVLALKANGTAISEYGSGKSILFVGPPMEVSLKYKTTGVGVYWDLVDGADKYRVFRKVGSGDWTKLGTTNGSSYLDKNVVYGKTYQYMVRAMTAGGSFATKEGIADSICYQAPAPKITLSNVETGIRIKWATVSGAAKYRIFVKNEKGAWTKLATVKEGTTYTDTNVTHNKSYTYAVVGMDSAGRLMNDYGKGETIVRFDSRLFVNYSLKSVASGVKVNWKAFDGAGKYRVYCLKNGSWAKIATVSADQLFYRDTTAVDGQTYTYTVVAMTSSGKEISLMDEGKSITYVKPVTEAVVVEAEVTDADGNTVIYRISDEEITEDYVEIVTEEVKDTESGNENVESGEVKDTESGNENVESAEVKDTESGNENVESEEVKDAESGEEEEISEDTEAEKVENEDSGADTEAASQ